MPHYYDRARTRIQLDEALDAVGIRFGHADGPTVARTAQRMLTPAPTKAARDAEPVRRFGRFMVIHESGASNFPFETVVNALPARLASRVARTMPVFVERESKLRLVATEQILVTFKPKAATGQRRKLLEGLDLMVVGKSEFDARRHILASRTVRRASRSLDLANQLAAADDVIEFAAPNFLAEIKKPTVNDPQFGAQWHLNNTGQKGGAALQDVRALGAWSLVGGGNHAVVIAIIDDGIDLDHPDLEANVWVNPTRGARDRHGRDFFDDSDPYNPRPKVFNAPFNDTDTNDIHGTPCAGVAAAVGNNGRGVAGIAWNCQLMAVKILAGPGLAPNDRIADAIRYASQHADVLSCSWAVARHPDIESALDYAVSRGRAGKGSVVCAASGNDNASRISFPSSDESVIGVGACNDRGRRSRYSNYGPGLTLVAPSGDDNRPGITTTDVSLRGKGYAGGAYCDDFSGTSSATPLAAGVAALTISADRSLEWKDVREILTSTAERIDPANGAYSHGYSLRYGYGRVNAEAAVDKALKRKARRRTTRRTRRATTRKR